ncbi:hypothetical protein Anas_05156 [Armadillidium nasatum]|uniref:Uncharacterized protein n=1 Tax=Armadillidium nasatum TaxID=96803 RepID=A0A5N5SXP5_9CRUS|nr:hypothetical protein Anas_05156 [Armadillidium nasatum]
MSSHFLGYFGSLSSYAFCCSEDSCHYINECINKNQSTHYIAKEKLSFGKRNNPAQILTFDFKEYKMITKGFFAYFKFPKKEFLEVATILGLGFSIGHYLDTVETERQTLFRKHFHHSLKLSEANNLAVESTQLSHQL